MKKARTNYMLRSTRFWAAIRTSFLLVVIAGLVAWAVAALLSD